MATSKEEGWPDFVVEIYETEYRQIQAWVAKHQHIQTGGDLFGLWADEHTAVVQLVLGPGKNCRRSAVSFYQDVDYLERVGNVLTSKEGLCRIGEWHSHHRIGLTRPSGGDEKTVWTNMDRYGIHRFFLFIATIGSSKDDVNIGCFLFENYPNTRRQLPAVLGGEILTFAGNEESPFRKSVHECLTNGAESINSQQSLKKFKSKVTDSKNERDSTSKRPNTIDENHPPEKRAKRPNDQYKEDRHSTHAQIHQTMVKPKDEQEVQPIPATKDAEKSKKYQEIESQRNELGSNPCDTGNKDDRSQRSTPMPPNDPHKEACHSTQTSTDQKLTGESKEVHKQEDKPRNDSIEEADKTNELGYIPYTTTSKNDNQQSGLAGDNIKPEKMEKEPISTPFKTTKVKMNDADQKKGYTVHYIGSDDSKATQKGFDDVQTTEKCNEILTPSRTEVKPSKNDKSTELPKPDSNPLGQNENTGRKELPKCEPQPYASKINDEDELNDVQQNDGKQTEKNANKRKSPKATSCSFLINTFRRKKTDKEKNRKSENNEKKEMEGKKNKKREKRKQPAKT